MEIKAKVVNFGVREKWKPQSGLREKIGERAMGEDREKKLFSVKEGDVCNFLIGSSRAALFTAYEQ